MGYPTTVFAPATRTNGQTIDASHVNDLQTEVTAIEGGLLNGAAHTLKPNANATYDLGISGTAWRDLFITRNATVGNLLTVSGFGTHSFSAGGTGANELDLTNTTSGAANRSQAILIAGTSELDIQTFSQGYSTSGLAFASGSAVASITAGGLSIGATHGSGGVRFYAGGTTRRGLIDTDGTWTMDAYGSGTATFSAAGKISSVSDERLKHILGPLGYGLAEILALHPVRYTWNDLSGLDDPAHTEYGGFTAQDVQRVMPLAIGTNAQGYLSFADRPILGAVVNAIQALEARLWSLENAHI